MGKVVSAAWHFEGAVEDARKRNGWLFNKSASFPVKGTFTPVYKTGSHVRLKTGYTFTKLGTYFPTLRVASQRQGDTINTIYTHPKS